MMVVPCFFESLLVDTKYSESSVRIRTEGHEWRIRACAYGRGGAFEVNVYLDGQWREDLSRGFGGLVRVARVRLGTPFPVVAVREHSWCGHGQETWFYGFKGTRMWLMGQPPETGEGGGPVLYRGKPGWWLFDNWCYYTMSAALPTESPLTRSLYRIDKSGKLQFVRSWKAPFRKRLPDPTRISFY